MCVHAESALVQRRLRREGNTVGSFGADRLEKGEDLRSLTLMDRATELTCRQTPPKKNTVSVSFSLTSATIGDKL